MPGPVDQSAPATYRISERIATGGMAEVYMGWAELANGALGPPVAVKRLLPHLVSDRAVVHMFLNEARITQQISHPNVVRIYDVAMLGHEPVIAMELLSGRSFAEMRTQAAEAGQHIPLGITLRILTEACRGLDAAHRAVDEEGRELRIVHRDFTPDNIHVGFNGDVKVIDFGIATAATVLGGTEPGTLKGKFFYMSPEMIAGGKVDHRADLFAAGVMLYEQLCGRRPFTGLTPDQVLSRIAEGRPRPPRSFDPSVPDALELICLTALAREPAARFGSLNEFIEAIEAVGGAAQLASREEVAQYVRRLFPEPSAPEALAPRATPVALHVAHPQSEPAVQARPGLRRAPFSLEGRGRTLAVVGAALAAALVIALSASLWPTPSPTARPSLRLAEAEREHDPSRRRELLKEIMADPRSELDQLARAGGLLLEAHAPDDALAAATLLERRFPDSVEGFLLEGRSEASLRHGKRAEASLEKAADRGPKDARVDLARADLYQAEGDFQRAAEALGQAQGKQPHRADIAFRRGYLLSQMGELGEAAQALAAALQRGFEPDAAAELAFVRFRQGRHGEALVLLRRALARDPGLAVGYYYLGAVLFSTGDPGGAEHAYREADHLNPKDGRALAGLCELELKLHRPDEAQRLRTELTARFPAQAQRLTASCQP